MKIDWLRLARDVGSVRDSEPGQEHGGDSFARAAIERLIGETGIAEAVDYCIAGRPGSELAMNVLRLITSERATRIAYDRYRASKGQEAMLAIWLVKQIAHPCAVAWLPELLADANVARQAAGILDQLLWCSRVEPAEVEPLLVAVETHALDDVRETGVFIRGFLRDRAARAG